MIKPWFLFSFSFFGMGAEAQAAACCGGGFVTPAIISGDEQSQLTLTTAYSEIVSEVYPSGWWRRRTDGETFQNFRLDAATLVSDRFQVGLTVPVVRREKTTGEATGLGDLSASLGYEYLPDWDYNPWRPKGVLYLQGTAPTGVSIYDAQGAGSLGLANRGRGFWAVGAGTILTKSLEAWDGFLNIEVHRAFTRSDGVAPGFGGNVGLGLGYSVIAPVRLGGALTWSYEDAIQFPGATTLGNIQRFATAALSLSYLWEDWAATLAYSDQTWFGSPSNAMLMRGGSVQLQRRFSR